MSLLTDALNEGMEQIASSFYNSQDNVKIIEAKIVSLTDASVGKYKINYLGQPLIAYSNNTSIEYKEDDLVYVVSKDGRLDSTLIIIGATSPYVGLYDTNKDTLQYKPLSENLLDIDDINLCSYKSPENKEVIIDKTFNSNLNLICNSYLNDTKTFCVEMGVSTKIESITQRANGNYGIIIKIPVIKNNIESVETFIFDNSKMLGNPYEFENKVIQRLYITFDEDTKFNVTNKKYISMEAFVKDFPEIDNTKPDDIFLTDFSFYPVEVIDTTQMVGNYLSLTASQGKYFASNFRDTKDIIPSLYVNGSPMAVSGLDCYWFLEDYSVTPSSSKYNRFGGVGWRCLNKTSEIDGADGAKSEVLVTNEYKLEVKQSDVYTINKYKCVILYNGVEVSKEISLQNLNSSIKLNLDITPSYIMATSTVSAKCTLDISAQNSLELNEDDDILFAWAKVDETNLLSSSDFISNKLSENTENIFSETINFLGSLITGKYNIIKCSVYRNRRLNAESEERVSDLLGSVSAIVKYGEGGKYVLVLENGNVMYQYDAAGNSPLSDGYNGPIASITRETKALSFKIYKENGTEFTDDEYSLVRCNWKLPKNSMMYNFYIGSTSSIDEGDYYTITSYGQQPLTYSINSQYDYTLTDNTIGLEVEIDKDNILNTIAEIVFAKEGESGTNGTEYTAVIRAGFPGEKKYGYNVKNEYGIRQKVQLVYIVDEANAENNKWYLKSFDTNKIKENDIDKLIPLESYSNLLFETKVYKSGIEEAADPKVTYKMFDEKASKPYISITEDGILSAKNDCAWGALPDNINIAIVQADITVANDVTEQIIHTYYPIELTRITKKVYDKLTYLPDIDGGFDTVLYKTDGTAPGYDNSKPFVVDYSINKIGNTALYTYTWNSSDNIAIKESEKFTDTISPTPAPKYDSADANNYVSVKVSNLGSSSTEVTNKLNADNTNRDELYNTLAQYVVQYYGYSNIGLSEIEKWESKLLTDSYMTNRSNCLTYLTNILSIINELKSYFSNDLGLSIPSNVSTYETTIKNNYNDVYNLIKDSKSFSNLSNLSLDYDSIKTSIDNAKLGDTNGILNHIKDLVNKINARVSDCNKYITLLNGKGNEVREIYTIVNTLLTSKTLNLSSIDISKIIKELYQDDNISVDNTKLQTIINNITETTFCGILKEVDNTFKSKYNSALKIFNTTSAKTIADYKEYILKPFYNWLGYFCKVTVDINEAGTNNSMVLVEYNNSALTLSDNYNKYLKEKVKANIDNIKLVEAEIAILNAKQKELTLEDVNTLLFVHVKPIVFRLNANEFSWLNGWDGNKLYIDDGGDFIVAPQIGAGTKNEDNTFTGITMGVKYRDQGLNSDIGLFGFYEGEQSIFLDAKTGKAQFGVTGSGQINIDPRDNHAKLYSGNFYEYDSQTHEYLTDKEHETGKGLLIDLTKPEIRYGSNNFYVDENGNAHFAGADSEEKKAEITYGPTVNITISGNTCNDGINTFTKLTDAVLLSDNGLTLTLGTDGKFHDEDNNVYSIVTSVTEGVASVLQETKQGNNVYYFYDGTKKYDTYILTGFYKSNTKVSGNGLDVTSAIDLYLNPTTLYYTYVYNGQRWRVYLFDYANYLYYVYHNEKDNYYYYYVNGVEKRYFFDGTLVKDGALFIYKNGMFEWTDTKNELDPPGKTWYLETSGEKKGKYYYMENNNKYYMENELSDLAGWNIGQTDIYSCNEKMYLYSNANIGKNGETRIEPAIYAQPTGTKKHNSLESLDEGFYLAPSGMSINDTFRVSDKGIFMGKINKSTTGYKTYWTVYGDGDRSYIYFNRNSATEPNINDVSADSEKRKVYIGTDGIVLSNQFKLIVDNGESKDRGKLYLGNLQANKYWLFHNNSSESFMYYGEDDKNNERGSAKLTLNTDNSNMKCLYLGTDGIRFGSAFKAKIDGADTYLEMGNIGYTNGVRNRAFWVDSVDVGGDSKESVIYHNRNNNTRGGSKYSVSNGLTEVNYSTRNDISISTEGIRVGAAFWADNYMGTRTEMVVRVMKDKFYLGTENADGTVTWELYSGGGGGSLPQAEQYSF